MKKPKNKWWDVKKFDVGGTLGNPDYIKWADKKIAELENRLASQRDDSPNDSNKKNPCDSCQTWDMPETCHYCDRS